MSVGKRGLKGKRGTKYVNSDYLLRKIEDNRKIAPKMPQRKDLHHSWTKCIPTSSLAPLVDPLRGRAFVQSPLVRRCGTLHKRLAPRREVYCIMRWHNVLTVQAPHVLKRSPPTVVSMVPIPILYKPSKKPITVGYIAATTLCTPFSISQQKSSSTFCLSFQPRICFLCSKHATSSATSSIVQHTFNTSCEPI